MVTTPNATAARRQKRRCVADGLYGSFPDDALLAIEAVSEIETRDLSPTDRCFVDETSLAKALEAYTAYVDDASPVAEAERIRLRHRRGWPADEWCFGEGVDWQTAFARYGVAGTTAEVSDGLEMSPPRSRLLSFLTWSQSPLFPHDATLVSYHFADARLLRRFLAGDVEDGAVVLALGMSSTTNLGKSVGKSVVRRE